MRGPQRRRGQNKPLAGSALRTVDPQWRDVCAYALDIYAAIDTPRSLMLSLLAREGEFEQLVACDINPSHYIDAQDFYLDYQATKLLSKNPLVPAGIDRQQVAIKKFIATEVQCREANGRFRDDASPSHGDLRTVFYRAQGKIASVLGDPPALGDLDFRFGPGSAYGVRGMKVSPSHKLQSDLQCTHTMVDILPEFLAEFPSWVNQVEDGLPAYFGPTDHHTVEVSLVNGSRLGFVPKDAKTDRITFSEPLLNGLMQKGIGSFMKARLRRAGIDLTNQEVNAGLARVAVERQLVTADFSSASDTIAYNLVWSLLPPAWAEMLDACRSPCFEHEGGWYPFQKFSSMGNAYTFELETLIFYALAHACCIECGIEPIVGFNISVYGDDVIIPQGAFALFERACDYAGFTLNRQKTYAEGPFRESCGADFFTGVLVTPFRLKRGFTTASDVQFGLNLISRVQLRLSSINTNAQKAADVNRRLALVHARGRATSSEKLCFGPWSGSAQLAIEKDPKRYAGDRWCMAPFDAIKPRLGDFGYHHKAILPRQRREVLQWDIACVLYAAMDLCGDPDSIMLSGGASLREKELRCQKKWVVSSSWDWPDSLSGLYNHTD